MQYYYLIILAIFITINSTAQKRTNASEFFVKIYVEEGSTPYRERVILCKYEDGRTKITNRLVYIKSKSVDLSLKVIKRKLNAKNDWIGVSATGNHYLISTYHLEGYYHVLFRPINFATGEFLKSAQVIQISGKDLCRSSPGLNEVEPIPD
jgi:hypothetical protein